MSPSAPTRGGPSLATALAGLRATPPAGFAERVLGRLGLPGDVDEFALLVGPAGPLFVAFNPRGVAHVVAAPLLDGDPERFVDEHRRRFGREAVPAPAPGWLSRAVRTGQGLGLVYDLRGLSEFETAVLGKALDIPRGELRPYAWVAREIGRPRAVRAVGSALGRNPVPVLIPCHRVVRSDGCLGEYVFGTEGKRALLGAESVDVDEVERLARAGTRFIGDRGSRVFCYPTCRNVADLADSRRVPLADANRARRAGYRPCADCRPAPRLTA